MASFAWAGVPVKVCQRSLTMKSMERVIVANIVTDSVPTLLTCR
jgi:hypothetical protein